MNKLPSRRRTAWHEAGHSVVAWSQGFTPILVSIRRQGESFGRSHHTPAGNPAVPEERQRENIVAMGGWAAELVSGEASDGITYDSGDMSAVLNSIAPDRIAIELGWAEAEAHRIVTANVDRVQRLAEELLRRDEIEGAANILAIIEGPASQ
ncbi:hypothetical protein [Bradyrhizobium sp. MOS002]|uniref:hypothetical protein n=1 Tax=Bradyrhizobium sp. MOS002 TaxID=2133947 RepID=UPI000D11830F|nr:hypothetical protein [Bradyrhizobium sp. MOS002]PSO29842.1 hypothetical protein C7G41_24165 [Bradyrhizobium sp. MOS002]